MVFQYMQKLGYEEKAMADIGIDLMVHDSIEVETPIEHVLPVIEIIRFAMTTGVRELIKHLFGFEFNVDLAIDFEIGASHDTMTGWDWTMKGWHPDSDTMKEYVVDDKTKYKVEARSMKFCINRTLDTQLERGGSFDKGEAIKAFKQGKKHLKHVGGLECLEYLY